MLFIFLKTNLFKILCRLHSSPENLQNKEGYFIKPVYIAYESLMDGYVKHPQLHIVKKYILQNYSFFRKINKWIVYKIN